MRDRLTSSVQFYHANYAALLVVHQADLCVVLVDSQVNENVQQRNGGKRRLWNWGVEEEFSGSILIQMGGGWQLLQLHIANNHYPNTKTHFSRKIHPTLLY